jgi:putative transcriptional regulator
LRESATQISGDASPFSAGAILERFAPARTSRQDAAVMTLMRIRRVILLLGVLLASPMLFTAALSKPEATPQPAPRSLAGQLLVASPEMGDPRFQRTVILMVRHSRDGAFGIVINRPLQDVPTAKLLDALGLDSKDTEGRVRLFAGGPVQPDRGFVVHGADYHRSDTIDIDGRVAMTASLDVLGDIGRHAGPRQRIVALGYAGWGPGQLEGELALGGWFTVPEDPGLVFDVDRDKLWDEAMKRRTMPI